MILIFKCIEQLGKNPFFISLSPKVDGNFSSDMAIKLYESINFTFLKESVKIFGPRRITLGIVF